MYSRQGSKAGLRQRPEISERTTPHLPLLANRAEKGILFPRSLRAKINCFKLKQLQALTRRSIVVFDLP